MRKICFFVGCLILAGLTGCNEGYRVKLKCDEKVDLPRCTADSSAVEVCKKGYWEQKSCESACVYGPDGAICDADRKIAICTAGQRKCTDGGFLAECGADAKWQYRACPGGCVNNICNEEVAPPEPGTPTPKKNLAMRRCSSDKRAIEVVDASGNVKETLVCVEMTGFESTCQEYSNGHVGCTMPETCEGVFEKGHCVGDIYLGCDDRFIDPVPYARSCAETDMVCVADNGLNGCYETCDAPGADIACDAKGISVERCLAVGGKNVVVRSAYVCKDDSHSVSCAVGNIVEKVCDSGSKCLDSLGICVKFCDAADAGKFECDNYGELFQCQPVEDGYGWISVGKRECDGDFLNSCREDDSGYTLRTTDCLHYVDPQSGKQTPGRCVSNYGYYTDYDVCYPITEGVECGDVTEDGVCLGSKLRYCDEDDHILMEGDCSKRTEDGYTSCSVVAGYADCRKPCRESGKGTCSLSAGGESYLLTICAPDDGGGNLSYVEGEVICVGDKLYSCSATGTVVIENCAAFGGVCHVNHCAYPACRADLEPVCIDDAMIACRIGADGILSGEAVQTMFCDAEGNCRHCEQGKVVE